MPAWHGSIGRLGAVARGPPFSGAVSAGLLGISPPVALDATSRIRSMTRVNGIDFDWDQWNVQKNETKHGVSALEAESAFYDSRYRLFEDVKHSRAREKRCILYGRSSENRVLYGSLHREATPAPRDHSPARLAKGAQNLWRVVARERAAGCVRFVTTTIATPRR